MLSIGIDLGGTKILAGVLNENGDILASKSVRCNKEEGKDALIFSIRGLCMDVCGKACVSEKDIISIGMGFPGTMSREDKVFCHGANLCCLDGVCISEIFPHFDKKMLFIENDANAAALGESIKGEGRGVKNFVMLTLGTGIGCGIVIDGKIYTGVNGGAGEAGHMVINAGGRKCGCGRYGCFEQYASATGLIKTSVEEMSRDENSLMWELCGGKLENITGSTAFDAQKLGDGCADRIIDRYTRDLAAGIINVIAMLQPEVIAVGGGVANQGEGLLEPVREVFERERYSVFGEYTKIKIASCRDAGLVGAAMLYKCAL